MGTRSWLDRLLPGLAALRRGRWGLGLGCLAVWTGCLAVLALRWDRVRAAVAGGPGDARLAVLVLGVAPVVAWWLAARSAAPGPPGGGWRGAARRFARSPTAVAGLLVVVGLYLTALLAPLLAPFDPLVQGELGTARFLPPSVAHPLGTDQFARDILSRVLYGARISLSIGFVAVGIAVTLGTLVGAVAGYLGGWVDGVTMRIVDTVLAFPRLVLLIAVVALLQPSIFVIVGVLGLTLWPSTARLVRGEVLSLRERAFVDAARSLGYSRRRIVLRHLIPNALGPVIVAATLGIGNTIVLEAGLSFLGLGVQPPTPSWGTMVADGRQELIGAWWLTTFPGLAIVLTVLAFNLVGDGLREALDVRG